MRSNIMEICFHGRLLCTHKASERVPFLCLKRDYLMGVVVDVKLTDKQQLFVDEYLIDLNATQAAIRAGYSPKTAKSAGSRLLTNVDISNAIKERLKEKESELIATQDEILKTLTRQSRRQEFDYNVVVLKEKTIEDGVVTERERAEVVKVPTKNSDSIKASELLGKYYSIWTDRHQVEGNLPITIVNDLDD